MSIGIYDSDFMSYKNVIPNLECAKLCAFFRNKHQIAVLAPTLEPERYSHFFFRKEYDDGRYPDIIFNNNVDYGGRVFTNNDYIPLNIDIEQTPPDFSIYQKFSDNYGITKKEKEQFSKMMRAVNLRLAQDQKNVDEYIWDQLYNVNAKTSGIILHDYHLENINEVFEVCQELSKKRLTKNETINTLPIGTKYPIQIYDSQTLLKWCDIYPMTDIFCIQFHGLMDNEVLYELITKHPKFCRTILYMVDSGCSSENDFLENNAIKIFKQVLFCRMCNTTILLKSRNNFFVTKQMKDFITLINNFSKMKWQENFLSTSQTLYKYCSQKMIRKFNDIYERHNIISQNDMREVFQYMRIHNYELFKMFYEWDKVYYEGGEIKNEWTRNKG